MKLELTFAGRAYQTEIETGTAVCWILDGNYRWILRDRTDSIRFML